MTERTDQLRTHLWPAVRPPIDDLRGRIEWTATEGLQQLVLVVKVGQSKVSNLQKPRTFELDSWPKLEFYLVSSVVESKKIKKYLNVKVFIQ